MKVTLALDSKIVENILHNGLRVITPISGVTEADQLVIYESENSILTGRIFYATVSHLILKDIAQIKVGNFMETINEKGDRERFPMTGEFESEKVSVDTAPWNNYKIEVSGDSPVWMYVGEKWIQEVSLRAFIFGPGDSDSFKQRKVTPPRTLAVNVTGQGGDTIHLYDLRKGE